MVQKVDIEDSLEERIRVARDLLRISNPEDFLNRIDCQNGFNINLLYGYIQSYVQLAYVGDVHTTATNLKTTRQSIKRHILELESLLDVTLFEVIGTRSKLTSAGILWLPRAQEIFDLADNFLKRRGNAQARYQSADLPLRMLMHDPNNSQLLRDFANLWMQGGQTTSSDCYAELGSHCILYERVSGAWHAREIGEKSEYCKWFGPNSPKKNEGKPLSEMESGDDLGDEIELLLDRAFRQGGLHFSETTYSISDPQTGTRRPALIQRLVAELIDQEGRPVVSSIIEIIDPLQTNPAP